MPNSKETIQQHLDHYHDGQQPKGSCKFIDRYNQMEKEDRIMAISDIHQSGITNIDPGDAGTVMIAGDFMGSGYWFDRRGRQWLENKFFPWCRRHADKRIVVIPGNHDRYVERNGPDGIKWPDNVSFLVDQEADIGGMKVYGTPWCGKHKNGAYEVSSEKMAEEFSKIPEGLDVLIAHTPPMVEGEDIDSPDGSGRHFGSPELTKAILEKKPKLVLCGHIHTASHRPIKIGDSTVVNVSLVGSTRDGIQFNGRKIAINRKDGKVQSFDLDHEDDAVKGTMRGKVNGLVDGAKEFAREVAGTVDDAEELLKAYYKEA